MQSKARFLGHAIHPMLVVFPLGLLTMSLVFDGIALGTGAGKYAEMAYYMISVGLIGGVAAAIPGLIDFLAIPEGTRAKTTGVYHMLANTGVMILFLGSWLLRHYGGLTKIAIAPIAISAVGLCLGLVSAWLGGELVEKHGVGVSTNAHVNSPGSVVTSR